jgi:hypothetical protein
MYLKLCKKICMFIKEIFQIRTRDLHFLNTLYMDLDKNILLESPYAIHVGKTLFHDFNTNRSPAIKSVRVVWITLYILVYILLQWTFFILLITFAFSDFSCKLLIEVSASRLCLFKLIHFSNLFN